MPSASVGTMAPPVAELLAASDPATPSMAPFPNSSGLRDQRVASLYPIMEATVAPSAGRMPMKVPMPEDRSIARQVRR
jgi:hypothetical protein